MGIRVHVVLPGRSPETKFGENARAYFGGQDDPVYGAMVDAFIQMARDSHSPVTHAGDVANAILPLRTIKTRRCIPLPVKMPGIFTRGAATFTLFLLIFEGEKGNESTRRSWW